MGALILQPLNTDFWVTLGSVSSNLASKQHSFIRAQHTFSTGLIKSAWKYSIFLCCTTGTYQKLSLGASIVEPLNKDFWVTLGSISSDLASKQKVLLWKQQVINFCLYQGITNSLTSTFIGTQVTSNWQHKHLIVLEALIPHLPCHGLEISLQLPVDLWVTSNFFSSSSSLLHRA